VYSGTMSFYYDIHSLVPWCDPRRDNSVEVVSRFWLSGYLSSVLLYPCAQACHARESAIQNLVQFNHISNVLEAFAEHKIDYEGLYFLSSRVHDVAVFLKAKRPRQSYCWYIIHWIIVCHVTLSHDH
jgi:hypothetical protein